MSDWNRAIYMKGLKASKGLSFSSCTQASFELSNTTVCAQGSKLWCSDLDIDIDSRPSPPSQFDVSFSETLLKIVATRGEIFSLKSTKYHLAGSLDRLGELKRFPDSLAATNGPTSKGGREWRGREGKGREGRRGESGEKKA